MTSVSNLVEQAVQELKRDRVFDNAIALTQGVGRYVGDNLAVRYDHTGLEIRYKGATVLRAFHAKERETCPRLKTSHGIFEIHRYNREWTWRDELKTAHEQEQGI